MVEGDARHHGDVAVQRIGRVQAAAEADLDHRGIDALPGEGQQAERGRRLEEGGVDLLRPRENVLGTRLQPVQGDRVPVRRDALREGDEVRRGIASGEGSSGPEHRVRCGGDGTLPVRSADMEHPKPVLRSAKALQDELDALEAPLHGLSGTPGKQPAQRGGVRGRPQHMW